MKVCVWKQNIAFTAQDTTLQFFSVRFDNWILLFASCGCVATRNKKMNKSWACHKEIKV